MDTPDIKTLASKLGFSRVLSGPKWIRFSCPFTRMGLHKPGSKDAHISFAISVSPGDISSYHCFSCREEGNLTNIFDRFREIGRQKGVGVPYEGSIEPWIMDKNKPDWDKIQQRFGAKKPGTIEEKIANYFPSRKFEFKVAGLMVGDDQLVGKPPDPLPETALDNFQPLNEEATAYLHEKRKLTDALINQFELKWHPCRRIGIPIRDRDGKLMGISGRAIDPDVQPKFLHSKDFPRNYLLYGEDKCTSSRTGYLVEGFFDVHRLYGYGYRNALAMMGTYLSDFQQRKIVSWFDTLVVALDGDKAGYEGASRIFDQLGAKVDVKLVVMPESIDPDDLSADQARSLIGPINS